MDPNDKFVFDDECSQLFAVQPDIEGIVGDELDICHNPNGRIARGGQPTATDAQCTTLGKEWRDKNQDEIDCPQHVHPWSNGTRKGIGFIQ